MFVSFIWFPAPLIGALRERPHRRIDGLLPTGASCDPCPLQPEKRKVHALEKNSFVKAVCLVAADGCGCRFARVRPRAETDRKTGDGIVGHQSQKRLAPKAQSREGFWVRTAIPKQRQAEDGVDSDKEAGGRRPVTMARRPRFLGMKRRIKARGQVTVTRCGEKMRFQGGREPSRRKER
jgi:hypothetical protein